jgi:hypothetical protein
MKKTILVSWLFVNLTAGALDLNWVETIGGPGDEICRRVAVDDNNNIYLAGSYYLIMEFGQVSGDPVPSDTIKGAGIFIAKYHPGGTLTRVRTIHSPDTSPYLPESSGMAVQRNNLNLARPHAGITGF